jgi:hypothetical protein
MRTIGVRSVAVRGTEEKENASVPERRVVLGTNVRTGGPYSLGFDAFKAGVTTVGSVGAGKTSALRRFLYKFGLQTNFLHLDYAGTGHTFFKNWIALVGSACAWIEKEHPGLAAGLTQAFLSRFAFLTVDETGQNPIRFDLLKRRYVAALNRWEPITAVVNRVFLSLEMKRNEDNPQALVQLRRIGSAMLTLLVAAGRPIIEIHKLIDFNSDYYAALKRWIDGATFYFEPDHQVVRDAFKAIDDLNRLSPHQRRLETMSTRNAFDDFGPGKVLGMLFSEETFPMEEIAYGNRCLSVSSTVVDPVLRGQAYQMMMGLFHSTVEGRHTNKTVCVIADEIGHLSRTHPDTLARSRNFGVSYMHAYQGDEQWRQLGLPEMPTLARKLTSLDIRFRPTDFEAAKEIALHTMVFNPGAVFIEAMTRGRSTANGTSKVLSDSWGNTLSSSDSSSGSESFGSNEDAGTSLGRSIRGEEIDGDITRNEGASARSGTNHSLQAGWGKTNGSASSTGGSTALGETHTITEMLQQVLHRVGVEEQAFIEAQKTLHAPDRRAFITWSDQTTPVDMFPAAELPAELLGVPVAAHLEQWHDRYWSGRRPTLEPFDTAIVLASPAAVPPPRRLAASPQSVIDVEVADSAIGLPPDLPLDLAIFPSPALSLDGQARRLGLLSAVATVRLCTVLHVLLLTGWSYDRCYRELDRLADDGLADRIKPYAPRGEGSAPHIYILTLAGAQRLADAGAGDLAAFQRIAKNLSVFRRTLEANRPAQKDHRLWSSLVATLVVVGARAVDPAAYATDVRFDRERSLTIDLTPYTNLISAKHRALISIDPTKMQVPLLPDVSFLLHYTRRGRFVTHPVIAEVETGFGERDERDLAIGKSWKIRALTEKFALDHVFDGQTLDATAELRAIVWCRTPALEQRFFNGAAGVFGDARSPLWLTNGEAMPLAIPAGTKKRDIAAAAAELVRNVQTPIWRWLRYPDPTRRCRFIGTEEGKR